MPRLPSWILAAILGGAPLVGGAEPVAGSAPQAGAVSREVVEQKLTLVRGLLASSSTSQRIAASPDPDARRHYESARVAFSRAETEFKAGALAPAEHLLDEAMRLIGKASRAAPHHGQALEEQKSRYVENLKGLESMLDSYRRNRDRLQAQKPPVPGQMLDQAQVAARQKKAAELAAAGQYRDAADLLEEIQRGVVDKLNQMLGQTTLVYDLKFDTPEAEYQYEVLRYRSFQELMPLALAKFRPDVAARARVDALQREGAERFAQAEALMARGDHRGAIETVQTATESLNRAMEAAGLSVGGESGAEAQGK